MERLDSFFDDKEGKPKTPECCDACKVKDHDTCSNTAGCPCCSNTMENP
jgi:hypothetical protein